MRFLPLLAVILLLPVAFSCASGKEKTLEERAREIDRLLMCPVCPAQTIEQADTELSYQMKALVREQLAQGATREEILDFFVERYGPGVLASPPRKGLSLWIWVVPFLGLGAGGGILATLLRRRGRVPPQPALSAEERERYSARLEEELKRGG